MGKGHKHKGYTPTPPPHCLSHSSHLHNQEIHFAGKKLPGEVFDTKFQCEYALGQNQTPYNKVKEV